MTRSDIQFGYIKAFLFLSFSGSTAPLHLCAGPQRTLASQMVCAVRAVIATSMGSSITGPFVDISVTAEPISPPSPPMRSCRPQKVPLKTWILAFYLIGFATTGICSLDLYRQLGITYDTAQLLHNKTTKVQHEPLDGAMGFWRLT